MKSFLSRVKGVARFQHGALARPSVIKVISFVLGLITIISLFVLYTRDSSRASDSKSSYRSIPHNERQTSFNFTYKEGFFNNEVDRHRYDSDDVWRAPNSFVPAYQHQNNRPQIAGLNQFRSAGDYLKQPIIGDYIEGADKIFFMIKTGSNVLWERLPVHFLTTLTRVPNFAIYADSAESVGGYEVIDILANVSDFVMNSKEFNMYRSIKELHEIHGTVGGAETTFTTGWELDRYKNIPMLRHAWSVSNQSDWFVFIDADTYLLMGNLGKYLASLDPEKPLYFGNNAGGSPNFAHGGSGVVLSRKTMELTIGQFDKHPEWQADYDLKAQQSCCGDWMVALLLYETAGIAITWGDNYPNVGARFQGRPPNLLQFNEYIWCQPIISFHKITPKDVELLWEYERSRGPDSNWILHQDIYRDFVLPHIDYEMDHWDNTANGRKYTPNSKEGDEDSPKLLNKDGIHHPYDSFQACRDSCREWTSCKMFRYMPNLKFCGQSQSIVLGRKQQNWMESVRENERHMDKTDVKSGFMIDRIRNMRKGQLCDPLYLDLEADKTPDRTEGWAFRQRKKEEKI